MTNDPTQIDPAELPSLRALGRATIAAVLVVAALTVTVVLPAERGVDPTGIGDLLGLTVLGEAKQGTAQLASGARTDAIELTLQPGEETEVKAVMGKGDRMVYRWTTDSGELYYDFHGEPSSRSAMSFRSFEKDSKRISEGTFEAPFAGTHGWYWRNKTGQAITVSLETTGGYQELKRLF